VTTRDESWPGARVEPVEEELEAAPDGDEPAPDDAIEDTPIPRLRGPVEHAGGELELPPDLNVIEGNPAGRRRRIAFVVSRFNGEITSQLLDSALDEAERTGVSRDAITVMPVPGAFELPLAAMALAKTRRYSCVVALGCVVRGETPHWKYVAGEAASGLQLAALETGVPVSFGLLTVESVEQAQARVAKGAEAVRSGLEMADAFAQLRKAAAG
jgi:6,7-dimethyl-8-ribityllumazine synthase